MCYKTWLEFSHKGTDVLNIHTFNNLQNEKINPISKLKKIKILFLNFEDYWRMHSCMWKININCMANTWAESIPDGWALSVTRSDMRPWWRNPYIAGLSSLRDPGPERSSNPSSNSIVVPGMGPFSFKCTTPAIKMNEWMNERTNKQRNEQTNKWTNEQTNKQTSKQADKRTNKQINKKKQTNKRNECYVLQLHVYSSPKELIPFHIGSGRRV